jgi:hypothetical protein
MGAEDPVLIGHPTQRLQHFALSPPRRQVEGPAQADVFRHDRVDQLVERAVAEQLDHLDHVFLARADVAVGEVVRMHHLERGHPVRANLVCRISLVDRVGGGTMGGGHAMLLLQLVTFVKKGTRPKKLRPGQEARSAGEGG